jgi:hypothetical protein
MSDGLPVSVFTGRTVGQNKARQSLLWASRGQSPSYMFTQFSRPDDEELDEGSSRSNSKKLADAVGYQLRQVHHQSQRFDFARFDLQICMQEVSDIPYALAAVHCPVNSSYNQSPLAGTAVL